MERVNKPVCADNGADMSVLLTMLGLRYNGPKGE